MKTSVELFGRVAVNHAWDAEEPRMLVAEAKLIPGLVFNTNSIRIYCPVLLSILLFTLHS